MLLTDWIQYSYLLIKALKLDILNIILIVSIVIILLVLIQKILGTQTKNVKPTHMKKAELIASYENQMRETISSYHTNKEELKQQKIQTLKRISMELSTNIFFDKEEVKNILQKLSNMH